MRYEVSETEVLDSQTGLIWMKQIKTGLTLDQAYQYAEQVSEQTGLDWRLPMLGELCSLADRVQLGQASESQRWPDETFWSSSAYSGNTDLNWFVSFAEGCLDDTNIGRRGPFSVRLVRSNT